MQNWSEATLRLIDAARDEDLGAGDITSALLPDVLRPVTGRVTVRQAGVIGGLALAPLICSSFAGRLGLPLAFEPAAVHGRTCRDGDSVAPGSIVATVRGPQAAVLAAERTLLNFLGRLSGVATLTRRFVDAARAANPSVQILDTRKTIPGWRELDKYAVRIGGGTNHRHGLYDAVLIKDNHLAGIPVERLAAALEQWLARLPRRPAFVEVEVDRLAQFAEVCKVAAVDVVLLDNFTLDDLRAAVAQRDALGLRADPARPGARRLLLEASGGVRLDNVGAIAATGVDRISVGALTHSAPALDLGLDF